jgi:regulator of cell morphogenesis and NO signaling
MITIDVDKPVRVLALEDPRIRAALEAMGIDTCCGGGKPLTEAVREAGLEIDAVRARLHEAMARGKAEPETKRDWRQASLAELTDHIEEKHHAFLRDILPRLADRFAKVVKAHGKRHGDMLTEVQRVFAGLRKEIEAHLMKEEQILFPYLRQMSAAIAACRELPPMHCGSVANPIRQMEHEHENAGAVLSAMRERTSGYDLPDDACPTFAGLYEDLRALEADLHEHIFLENNILFPKAVGMEEKSMGRVHGKGDQL